MAEEHLSDGVADPTLPPGELAELADEMRMMWRALSRGAHLGKAAELPQRQQFWVLGVLAEGPKRMSDIAEWACTSPASVTGVVSRLEERGFVERVHCESDRRVVLVGLTDAGRAEVRGAKAQTAERLCALIEPLDLEERRELLRLFRKMTAGENAPTR